MSERSRHAILKWYLIYRKNPAAIGMHSCLIIVCSQTRTELLIGLSNSALSLKLHIACSCGFCFFNYYFMWLSRSFAVQKFS